MDVKQLFQMKIKDALIGLSLPLLLVGVSGAQVEIKQAAYQEARLEVAQATASPIPQPGANTSSQPNQPSGLIKQHEPLLRGLGVSTLFVILYLGILWKRPLWLLMLPGKFKIPQTQIELPLGVLLWLKYRPRVLDCWVTENLDTARSNFECRTTVKNRAIHIDIQVELGEKLINPLVSPCLEDIFKREACLLIVGDGGMGKTSLACQIGLRGMAEDVKQRLCPHRILPVLIEQELELKTFIAEVREQLPRTKGDLDYISEELLKALLRQRRILVIIDRLSEMSEITYEQIRKALSEFPVNALVITSRLETKDLGIANKTLLKPLPIEGTQLLEFVDAYLRQKGKRGIFQDTDEYLQACRRLSRLVMESDATPLLAKLYADLLIDKSSNGELLDEVPTNIPGLVLEYLNKLNGRIEQKKQRDFKNTFDEDAKVIAWECLRETYRSAAIPRREALVAIAAIPKQTEEITQKDPQARLQYLEDDLRLVQPDEKDHLRFALDPLAEYLAGLHLVKKYGANEESWQQFLDEAKNKPGNLEEIQGFLQAVRNCCGAASSDVKVLGQIIKVPDQIIKELGTLAGLDLDALEQEQQKRRIRRFISDLSEPALEDRLHAVEELSQLSADSESANLGLIRALKDSDPIVRSNAAKALGQAGRGVEAVVKGLLERLNDEDSEVRQATVVALGQLGVASEVVIQELLKCLNDEDSEVRQATVVALGQLGVASEVVVQELRERLNDENWEVHNSAGVALWQLGAMGATSDPIVQGLLKCLNEKDVGFAASRILVEVADSWATTRVLDTSELVVEKLLEKLNDEYARGREYVELLGKLGIASEPIVKGLLKQLDNNDEGVRWATARVLGQLGATSETVIHGLLEQLKNENSRVRQWAVRSLSKLRLAPELVVQGLKERLNDEDLAVCFLAAKALNDLGVFSEEVLKILLKCLNSDDAGVRRAAAEILCKLGNSSEAVMQGLLGRLNDEDEEVRLWTTGALINLGVTSESMVQELLSKIHHWEDDKLGFIILLEILGSLNTVPEVVMQALISKSVLSKLDEYIDNKYQRGNMFYTFAELLRNLSSNSPYFLLQLCVIPTNGKYSVDKYSLSRVATNIEEVSSASELTSSIYKLLT